MSSARRASNTRRKNVARVGELHEGERVVALQARRRIGVVALDQIGIDDVLDVEGSDATLGKTAGKDAAQRKARLIGALLVSAALVVSLCFIGESADRVGVSAMTVSRCSRGTTTTPLASPRITSPGCTVTPPTCTGSSRR